MRNILIFFILILLISCSKQEDVAIENCADNYYIGEEENDYVKFFYKDDPQIINLKNGIEDTKQKVKEVTQKIDQYLLDLKIEQKRILDTPFESLNKEQKTEYINIQTKLQQMVEKENKLETALHYQKGILKEAKSRSAWKEFKKKSLKSKIELTKYYNQYVECEKEHSKSPKAFELKWKDKK